MYKYKCAAAADADREAFHGVAGGLKALYPELVETDSALSDGEFLRKEFWHGPNRVMVQYSFSERSVTVFSEDWLYRFYEGREVAEGRFEPIAPKSSKKFTIISSVIFAALNFGSLLLIAGIVEFRLWIIYSSLAAVYIISAFIIKSKREIGEFKLLFIQFGGFITVAASIIAFFFDNLMTLVVFWLFPIAVLPPLILSFIIRLIIKAVRKYSKPTK